VTLRGTGLPVRVEVIVDVRVPAGEIHVGGVRVVKARTDADLGRELRTKAVRVPTQEVAEQIRMIVQEDPELELAE